MSFDLSRVRFDVRKDFLGVIMQQGRVQLDADWNEWVAQLIRRVQAGTLDVVGAAAVPRETPNGFLIQVQGGELKIGRGRIYVDGLLAENHGPNPPGTWDKRLAEAYGAGAVDYGSQPYFPDPPELPQSGRHLVYLDVWQRDVTHLQEPGLVEQAVGVDSTGRLQTVWQVKILKDVGDVKCATDDADISGWLEVARPSGARLSTDTADPPVEPDPCRVPPAAGYKGLENQLYRVEIHTGSAVGPATFKWSRDNATVATRIQHINPSRDQLTVESIGSDDILRFNDGDWVEITDDWRELHNEPGELRRIRVGDGVDDQAKLITLEKPLTDGLFPVNGQGVPDPHRHTRIRRWDQGGQVLEEDGEVYEDLDAAGATGEIEVPPAGTKLFLENGIVVDFNLHSFEDGSIGEFKSGDHWVFAARAADGSVELLEQAPPLGVHHHYARLALVTLPDSEPDDCRTLWPPVHEGESCDCSVCVKADTHNDDTATLQQAIDRIKDVGGTICVGPGTFRIKKPLHLTDAESVRIRGQGWKTVLIGEEPGTVLGIAGGAGIVLENLSIVAGASGSSTTPAVSVSDIVGLELDHVNVVCVAKGSATSAALEVSGLVIGCNVHDSVLVAERGLINAGGKKDYLLTGELRASRNLVFCRQRGFSFEDLSLHFGACRLTDNLILGCKDASVVATGGVLPGSSFSVADNVIYTEGTGVRAGVGGLRIRENEITAQGKGFGDGIALVPGLDPATIEDLRLIGNRIRGMAGNGIAIRQRVATGMIKQNSVTDVGRAALVMEEGGSAAALSVENNHFSGSGRGLDDEARFAGVQIIAVERIDFADNLVTGIAPAAQGAVEVSGLLVGGVGEARVAGNRFDVVGPRRIAGTANGIRLLVPKHHLAVDDNTVARIADDEVELQPASWYAVRIGRGVEKGTGEMSTSGFAALDDGKQIYLVTATRFYVLPRHDPSASVRGNRLRGRMIQVPLVVVDGVHWCLFADNHCEVLGAASEQAQLGRLTGFVVNASNNRFAGLFGPDGLALEIKNLGLSENDSPGPVLGNVSTGRIIVDGNHLGGDWLKFNVIGV